MPPLRAHCPASGQSHSTACPDTVLPIRSAQHGLNTDSPRERRRVVLHILNADFALEWTRPVTPNVKLVGPILPEPPAPLPAELEVRAPET